MRVPEQVQDAVVEERIYREAQPPGIAPAPVISWLRLAYAFESLVALQTILYVWTQVGGQGHMDLLPWYLKLVCAVLWAWCAVRLTAALVQSAPAGRPSVRLWLTSMVLVSTVMGCITYYYHAHEVPDEPDTDETSKTSVSIPGLRKTLHVA